MATSFRDWPWPLQALLYVGLTIVLVLAGFYVPGSPLASVRNQLESAQAEVKPLESDVQNLRVYKQRRAELQTEMDALQKQLATLQTIVPEDKETDQFILMVQRAAITSGVAIRSLAAEPGCSEALLFRNAVRDRGRWAVLLGTRLFLPAGPPFSNYQRGRPEVNFPYQYCRRLEVSSGSRFDCDGHIYDHHFLHEFGGTKGSCRCCCAAGEKVGDDDENGKHIREVDCSAGPVASSGDWRVGAERACERHGHESPEP